MTISQNKETDLLMFTPDIWDMNWYKESIRKMSLDLAKKSLERLDQKLKEQQ